jgi:hypothetical protein
MENLITALAEQSFSFVPSADLLNMLLPYHHNSDITNLEASFQEFHNAWNTSKPQRSLDNGVELYPYKGTLVSYYDLDVTFRRSNSHDYHGETDTETNWVVEHVDATTSTTGAAAADLGRRHLSWPTFVDQNPELLALHQLLIAILASLDLSDDADGNGRQDWEAMQTAFRVQKSREFHGEPGPEGVHQDDCFLTVVILFDRVNVKQGTGGSRIWSLNQECGKPTNDDIISTKLLGAKVLEHRFDAVFLLDRMVKHEALPIEMADLDGVTAVRDVLTFEVRKKFVE